MHSICKSPRTQSKKYARPKKKITPLRIFPHNLIGSWWSERKQHTLGVQSFTLNTLPPTVTLWWGINFVGKTLEDITGQNPANTLLFYKIVMENIPKKNKLFRLLIYSKIIKTTLDFRTLLIGRTSGNVWMNVMQFYFYFLLWDT